ncbi:NADPH oxidase 5 [Micropterus dolomieu]|uniref:NADPH oxidase 5 n=1 Tax=Micropterus dolomieu TaxID=147949 RepID=UPI001E8DEE77|nr:NADPH oxidase 5 [Micropterus dolomieu]
MSLDEDARWLDWMTRQFESIAGDDKEIDIDEFKAALKVKDSFFAERFFALFDSDGSSSISLDELLKALDLLIHGSETDKLRFLFQVYDVDGSGSIDPDELRTVLKSCLRESAISLPEEKLDDLTLALFESADKDNSGAITFEELKAELENFPEVMENLTISAANWLKPPDVEQKKRRAPRYLTRVYWHNNSRKLLFLCLYAGLTVLLFTEAMLRHSYGGGWFMVAKGCGQCLNFNCTLVMVLMLRRCLTWLRATWVVRVLPLDQNILLHQIVGYAILCFTLVHTVAHVFNFAQLAESGEYRLWEFLLTTRPGIGWVKGTASVTGVVLQALICLMVLCSCTFVRRSGHFECYVDGPYGTPTRQIFASEHAVLIGAGIGITPFASILQSIMYRYRMRKQNCPNCSYSWCENIKDSDMKLRKVDFIWINRDQKSFEWFVSLLTKLEMDQADEEPEGRFLEMHMYMTSALGKNDMKAIGLQMALDLLAKKEKVDSITGLRTRTQPGRPEWGKVFQKVSEEKKGKVHVFYCGAPALAKVIKAQCEHFGFKFYKENF